MNYTFGPVPSRRLGYSLGIDIIPMKVCTYNCIYCQLFQTSKQQITRQSFFNKEDILTDIFESIKRFDNIDYLTFSGSGEPTLNSDLGWLIDKTKANTNKSTALITNGSLLWMDEVKDEIINIDLVMPSVDAVTPEIWTRINRPANGLEINKVLDGIKDFCEFHNGIIWLEVMFTSGINDSEDEIQKIAKYVNSLKVNKVQINTVVRPPNENFAKPLNLEKLEKIATYFDHDTEIISSFNKQVNKSDLNDKHKAILDLLKRRPCMAQEMSFSLGISLLELNKNLQTLENLSRVIRQETGYYQTVDE